MASCAATLQESLWQRVAVLVYLLESKWVHIWAPKGNASFALIIPIAGFVGVKSAKIRKVFESDF